jgi:hypothetical protein
MWDQPSRIMTIITYGNLNTGDSIGIYSWSFGIFIDASGRQDGAQIIDPAWQMTISTPTCGMRHLPAIGAGPAFPDVR